jgi:hypothetical protein
VYAFGDVASKGSTAAPAAAAASAAAQTKTAFLFFIDIPFVDEESNFIEAPFIGSPRFSNCHNAMAVTAP